MTSFIAAYDVEDAKTCVGSVARIVEHHEAVGLPATFFVVGSLLDDKAAGPELRRLLDRPWADVQSHTYSHKLLRESRMHGPGVGPAEAKDEVERGKRAVEDAFGRPCTGLRTPFGFDCGLQGYPWLVEILAAAGLGFVSSDLRGPGESIPAPLKDPYTYAEDGAADLLEMPGHGWHDNVLKGLTKLGCGVANWPPLEPWFIPPTVPRTPEEEAEVYRLWIDKARGRGLAYVSLVWHPWSHYRFSADCRSVRLTLEYAKEIGMPADTFASWAGRHAEDGRDA